MNICVHRWQPITTQHEQCYHCFECRATTIAKRCTTPGCITVRDHVHTPHGVYS